MIMGSDGSFHQVDRRRGFLRPIKVQKIEGSTSYCSNAETLTAGVGEPFSITVPAGEASPAILLDFGREVAGYLFLDLCDRSMDPMRVNGDYLSFEYGPTPDSLFFKGSIHLDGHIAPREDAEWKLADSSTLYVDDAFLSLRYLRIHLDAGSILPKKRSVTMRSIGIRETSFPAIYKGGFRCGDDLLDRIWYSAAYTVRLCIQENRHSTCYLDPSDKERKRFIESWTSHFSKYVIWDAPRRDREVWLGDLRPEALAVYSAFFCPEVIASSLHLLADQQTADGLMPGNGTYRYQFIEYSFWWIIILWELYYHTGDLSYIKEFFPTYRKLMDWIDHKLGSNAYIQINKTWMWTLPRTSLSPEAQCVLTEALQCASFIERSVGRDEEADRYLVLREGLVQKIVSDFWDEERGIFAEPIHAERETDLVAQDTGVLAVLFGLVDAKKGLRILQYLREHMWTPYGSTTTDRSYDLPESNWPHNRQIWPFMNAYEVEARFRMGDVDGALELTRRCFGNMLEKGSATFWELVNPDDGTFSIKPFAPGYHHDSMNSSCHGWSANILHILSRHLLGITPLEPGFRSVVIEPNPVPTGWIEGTVPVPDGQIHISCSIVGDKHLTIRAPEWIRLVVRMHESWALDCELTINGVQHLARKDVGSYAGYEWRSAGIQTDMTMVNQA